jgi:hypothetical protein
MWQTCWSARERAAGKQSVAKNPDHNRHAESKHLSAPMGETRTSHQSAPYHREEHDVCGKNYIPNPLFEQLCKIEWGLRLMWA